MANTRKTRSSVKHHESENVFLFIPNLIGYSRIILAVVSLYYMPVHPRTCSSLYSVSCLLDAVDGYAARWLNQSTRFGAVLDMVTDRCTTACLLVYLASAFPRWSIAFQLLIILDISSHYIHMYTTLSLGEDSHKKIDQSKSFILNLYYTNKIVLFTLCLTNELFFIALYLLSFSSPLLKKDLLKQGQIFSNPYSAGAFELARANKIDSTIPWIFAGVSLPGMLLKQIINVVQLVKASRWLAESDIAARREAGTSHKRKST